VSLNVFSPYPGSEIFNDLCQAGQVKLDDSYLLRLTSNYTDYTNLDLIGCNADMTARELALWRAAFMVTGYLIGYVLYPSRILRTVRNVFFASNEAATVFEHRFKDALSRLKVLAREAMRPSGLRRTSTPPVEQ
jgi:anaerobic magnesium-protoporphyrin IX monomethyl ester cyclase